MTARTAPAAHTPGPEAWRFDRSACILAVATMSDDELRATYAHNINYVGPHPSNEIMRHELENRGLR